MNKKLIFLAVGLTLILVVLYFVNFFAYWGLCRPGTESYVSSRSRKYCYTPSSTEGSSCKVGSDCDKGHCVNQREGEGICQDHKIGCFKELDNSGEEQWICVD
jgi:hypothetical protein